MGRHKTYGKVTAALLVLLAGLSLSAPAPAQEQEQATVATVITRDNALRRDCRFFSPVVLRLSYGQRLEVLDRNEDWVWASAEDTRGCIHQSALTTRKFKATGKVDKDMEQAQAASDEEVALAGKGFSPEIENKHRENNPGLDYDSVDRIEDYGTDIEALETFIVQGGLNKP